MQAVILAAGRGSRMGALTEKTPKPMLRVNGRPILEYVCDALPEEVAEIIMIVGYCKEEIQNHFGSAYGGRTVQYVEQSNVVGGTADALWQARDKLLGKFLVMNGDDICMRDDIRKCFAAEWALLAMRVQELDGAAKIVVRDDILVDIIEADDHEGGAGLANMALYMLDMRIFNYVPVKKAAESSELGLPQTILQAAGDLPIRVIEATKYIRFTEPKDILAAEGLL